MTTNLSFSTAILLVIVSQSFFHNSLTCYAFSHDKTREALEIIIGGGGYASPAQPPECPPPPPPPCLPPASPAVQIKPPPPPLPPSQPPKPKYTPPSTRPSPGIEDPSGIKSMKYFATVIRGVGKKIGYDPQHITDSWTGDNPCTFKGVVCHQFMNRSAVVGVDFNGNHFNGYGGQPFSDKDTVLNSSSPNNCSPFDVFDYDSWLRRERMRNHESTFGAAQCTCLHLSFIFWIFVR
uniref:Leucine-rich repeat-containing N-terminal plant-type domain-containing protein n=1 Tax=Daucus carota subsp. sativus TaxID=79200 RepID=A0A166AYK8_DAUCS